MHLNSIQYKQYEGQPKEWELAKSSFSKITLLVGKNASGKSRTLNVIKGISSLINGERRSFHSADYDVNFSSGDDIFNIKLSMEKGLVTKEIVTLNDKVMLTRDSSGKGQIYTKEIDEKLKFLVPNDMLASLVRRDPEQHEFLEPLHMWANSVVHYRFADDNEKHTFIAFKKGEKAAEHRFNSIGLFKKGIDKFGGKFKSSVLLDMKSLGYLASDVGIKQPENILISEGPPIHCLYLQEEDLNCKTEQTDMSDGMFRALSLLIKLNYILLDNLNPLFSVDDIGEGLDYERSKNLIALIIKKAEANDIQLMMSTNDQFVMNGIPLEYWAITDRNKNKVTIINKDNSPDAFEKFKFIGLSNFEFLASDYFKS